MYTTIRKNSFKRIREILSKAAVISCYHYDDMTSSTNTRVTAEDVMAAGERLGFSRVSLDEVGNLSVSIHSNHFYTAYATAESARSRLTPQAFAKYFPDHGLNAAPAVDSDGDYEADCEGQEAARAERDYQ